MKTLAIGIVFLLDVVLAAAAPRAHWQHFQLSTDIGPKTIRLGRSPGGDPKRSVLVLVRHGYAVNQHALSLFEVSAPFDGSGVEAHERLVTGRISDAGDPCVVGSLVLFPYIIDEGVFVLVRNFAAKPPDTWESIRVGTAANRYDSADCVGAGVTSPLSPERAIVIAHRVANDGEATKFNRLEMFASDSGNDWVLSGVVQQNPGIIGPAQGAMRPAVAGPNDQNRGASLPAEASAQPEDVIGVFVYQLTDNRIGFTFRQLTNDTFFLQMTALDSDLGRAAPFGETGTSDAVLLPGGGSVAVVVRAPGEAGDTSYFFDPGISSFPVDLGSHLLPQISTGPTDCEPSDQYRLFIQARQTTEYFVRSGQSDPYRSEALAPAGLLIGDVIAGSGLSKQLQVFEAYSTDGAEVVFAHSQSDCLLRNGFESDN